MVGSKINYFYKRIDAKIRDLTRLLRDHGFNTTSSCQGGKGHNFERPIIQMEYYGFVFGELDEVSRLHHLLEQHGYKDFEIQATWRNMHNMIARYMEVKFFGDI